MILKIFVAVFLFELASAPILCVIADWIIEHWFEHKFKFVGKFFQITGEEVKKIGEALKGVDKEDKNEND